MRLRRAHFFHRLLLPCASGVLTKPMKRVSSSEGSLYSSRRIWMVPRCGGYASSSSTSKPRYAPPSDMIVLSTGFSPRDHRRLYSPASPVRPGTDRVWQLAGHAKFGASIPQASEWPIKPAERIDTGKLSIGFASLLRRSPHLFSSALSGPSVASPASSCCFFILDKGLTL